MTVYVETDFLLVLAKDDDWLQGEAEAALAERDVRTSKLSYLEILPAHGEYAFDYATLFANLLELVPVGSHDEEQIVLKAVNYYEAGMTAFDAFHAATAETRGLDVLSSDGAYKESDVKRIPLEPDAEIGDGD